MTGSGDVADFVLGVTGRRGRVHMLEGNSGFGVVGLGMMTGATSGTSVTEGIAVPAEEDAVP